MKLMIAGGGTGGHVFPGVAVADALARRTELSVCWVGTTRGIEAKVLPNTPWRFAPMEVSPLNGVRGKPLLQALSRLPTAGLRALSLLREFRPDAVLGVGGYAGGPVVALAAAMRVPTAVLEPNAIPGMTNRILSRLVRRAFLTHEVTLSAFPSGIGVVTGSPVRRAFLSRMAQPLPTEEPPTVLVLGGSQGAKAINQVLPETVGLLRAQGVPMRVIHQTGAQTRDAVRSDYDLRGIPDVEVTAFIEDVADVMSRASLVVCRAGAMTVAELGVIGRPCVYIPLPTAADDHQRRNAEAMTALGAARWVPQPELRPERLAGEIRTILGDSGLRERMAAAAWRSARPDAAGVIADALMELGRG